MHAHTHTHTHTHTIHTPHNTISDHQKPTIADFLPRLERVKCVEKQELGSCERPYFIFGHSSVAQQLQHLLKEECCKCVCVCVCARKWKKRKKFSLSCTWSMAHSLCTSDISDPSSPSSDCSTPLIKALRNVCMYACTPLKARLPTMLWK